MVRTVRTPRFGLSPDIGIFTALTISLSIGAGRFSGVVGIGSMPTVQIVAQAADHSAPPPLRR